MKCIKCGNEYDETKPGNGSGACYPCSRPEPQDPRDAEVKVYVDEWTARKFSPATLASEQGKLDALARVPEA